MRVASGAFVGALMLLPAAGTAAAADGQASRVGLVYRGPLDDLRLAIARDALPLGSKIVIVTVPAGAVLCCAVVDAANVLRPDEFDPAYLDHEGKATYALDPAGTAAEVSLGFGLVDIASGLGTSGSRLDLDGDGAPDGFRSCASGEGLHLTAWSGAPLAGARLWHAYYYLGYDTESDCEPADYE